MKALIYKDMFVLKQKGQIFSFLSSTIIAIIIGLFFRNLYGLALIVVLSIPIGGCGFVQIVMEKEERTNFDKRVISLPVTKKEIVFARFITSFIYLVINMVIALIYALAHVYLWHVVTLDVALLLWVIGVLLGFFLIGLNSIGYHWLGARKGTFLYLVVAGLSIVVYLFIFLGLDVEQFLSLGSTILFLIGCVFTILTLFISYFVSLKIFERKYS